MIGREPDLQSESSNQAAVGLSKIAMALRHHAWDQAGPRSLTPTQGQILAALRAAPTDGFTLNELVDRLAVSQPTVSDSVQALARKGLVGKCPHPGDRRSTLVSLTEAGEAEANRLALWPDFLIEAIDQLSDEERGGLGRSLVKMVHSLQLAGRIPIARMCVTCRFFRPFAHQDPDRPHHCKYVDAPLGDAQLRTECAEHEAADELGRSLLWEAFSIRHSIPVGAEAHLEAPHESEPRNTQGIKQ